MMEEVHVGHYILGRTIGYGSFAKVKQARHDLSGLRVAIKILNKRKMKNKNMISKVKREIKILRFINHPNIIKLYQVLDTTNDIFVVMQLAEQGELLDYIQNNQISEDEAKFIFRQIINGLSFAHANLIVHRDLKPENLLIDANRLIKIADFGLSNLMKDGRMLKTACGSPNYAAPQIIGQRKYEGTCVDVWSCGVILYTLLVGHLPFHEETVPLLYHKIQTGQYILPQTLSPAARHLIGNMLQVDPARRIRLHDVKNHPWIRPFIPIYTHIPMMLEPEKNPKFQLDIQLFNQIKTYQYTNPLQISDSKMRKYIRKGRDDSFVITYEILKDHKYNSSKAKKLITSLINPPGISNLILSQIQNILSERRPPMHGGYEYGTRYKKPIKMLLHIALQVLKQLQIEYSVKNEEYCLRCIYYPRIQQKPSISNLKIGVSTDEEQEMKNSEVYLKFSKKEIKFNLQIYSCDQMGQIHMVDLQVIQGHPLVFFNMASKFYSMIDNYKFY